MPLKVGPHIRIIVCDICLTGIFTTWKRKVNIEQVFEQSSNKLRRIPSISNTNRKFGRETGKIETDGQLKDVKAGEKMVTYIWGEISLIRKGLEGVRPQRCECRLVSCGDPICCCEVGWALGQPWGKNWCQGRQHISPLTLTQHWKKRWKHWKKRIGNIWAGWILI